MSSRLQLEVGDVVTQQRKDGTWHVTKILELDVLPDRSSVAHCLMYKSSRARPFIDSLRELEVACWHAPIAAKSFELKYERIGNVAVQQSELTGFIEYLKLTDFSRYVRMTGQDLNEIIDSAKAHYLTANSLCEKGEKLAGILEYTKAVDRFPFFFEAIDNRAFTYMELGKFKEALADFEQSSRLNPSGVAAFFSRGECLMKLGDLASAEAVFSEGLQSFPQEGALFRQFLDRIQQLRTRG